MCCCDLDEDQITFYHPSLSFPAGVPAADSRPAPQSLRADLLLPGAARCSAAAEPDAAGGSKPALQPNQSPAGAK